MAKQPEGTPASMFVPRSDAGARATIEAIHGFERKLEGFTAQLALFANQREGFVTHRQLLAWVCLAAVVLVGGAWVASTFVYGTHREAFIQHVKVEDERHAYIKTEVEGTRTDVRALTNTIIQAANSNPRRTVTLHAGDLQNNPAFYGIGAGAPAAAQPSSGSPP